MGPFETFFEVSDRYSRFFGIVHPRVLDAFDQAEVARLHVLDDHFFYPACVTDWPRDEPT